MVQIDVVKIYLQNCGGSVKLTRQKRNGLSFIAPLDLGWRYIQPKAYKEKVRRCGPKIQ
jgi:hypothetical protein